MKSHKVTILILLMFLQLYSIQRVSAATEPSAAEVAKKLANPTSAVGQMVNNFNFTEYTGDLPEADNERGWNYLFQPVLPFPQEGGNNIIFRPGIPFLANQPIFDTTNNTWDETTQLGDISFDLVYGGTSKSGFMFSYGVIGSIPTATSDEVGSEQWTLGPELLIGVAKKWGVLGLLVNHQWDIAGDNSKDTSITGGQYFYAFPLGDGTWQFGAGPGFSYNHNAQGEKWTLPVGIGLTKTTRLGDRIWKFGIQYWDYAKQPDAFGPDALIRFTVTKVVTLPWGKK